MQTTRIQLLILSIILLSMALLAQPAENPQTFCNPLNLNYRFMIDAIDAREAADPVIVLFQDDYYLFASRSGGYWTSTDLRDWTLIVPTGIEIEGYAPGIVAIGDTLFYVASGSSQIYKTGDPKSGVWQKGPICNTYGDPDLFLDDDGRLYMYYGLSNSSPTHVVELDPITFQEISAAVNIVYNHADIHGWERRGDDNLLDEFPWIEGCWMVKENNKYYLQYSAPGTEFKTYADGVYVADSPMGPFEYAEYSPCDFKPTGFICGTGHGNTFKDKDGQYWHIGTMSISVNADFERRLGLWPVAFDQDGRIRCNTVLGDYPQFYPGEKTDMIDNSFAGMLLLSYKKRTMASSSLVDHGVELAVDEEVRTYWCATTGGSDEWMMIDLGKECSVEAIQVNFAEYGTNPDLVRGRDKLLYEQYTIEKSSDGMNWEMLVDKSQNLLDVPHDYIELAQPATTRYIKLSNVFTPGQGNFAVRDLRIFGNSEQAVFTEATGVTIERDPADGRDAVIRWTPVADADGYIIRYGIAPDKLYNNYMVYDEDSVVMHSLNHGVDYYFNVEAFDSGTDYYQPIGEFQSFQSGNWNDVTTWARYDGTAWIHPAPIVPTQADGNITILEGHTVTVTAVDSADQIKVASGGTLVIEKGITFQVKNGIGVDLMVEGTIENYGSITQDNSATLTFLNNGIYAHRQNGGSLPSAMWKYNSTCLIDSVHFNVPVNGNQNFYNIVWNNPNQQGSRSLFWNGNTIGGDITIQSTGSGRWSMCAFSAVNKEAVVNINGDIIQSGGEFTATGTQDDNTTVTINHAGNINVTGGNFSITRYGQGDSGTTTWNLTNGSVSLTNATTQNENSSGAKFVFTGDGNAQTLTFDNVTFGEGGFPVEVDSGATLDMGTNSLEGNGSFNLKAGATLLTAHANGINGSLANTGSKTFDPGAGYGFNGSQAQVTGNLMPGTVNDLIIDNSAGVTLSNSVTVNGTMEIKSGAFSAGSNTLTYGPDASLKYSGATSQTTTDSEYPSSVKPKNLIIQNSKGVTLHASREAGYVDLSGKLKLDTNTMTADSASEGDISTFVVTGDGGTLKLNNVGPSQKLYPVGTTLYSPVWITNAGTADVIGVSALKDNDKAPYGGRVKVKWDIDEETAGGGDYTLQFGWMGSSEDTDFKKDRAGNARIFNLSTMTEAGTGDYTAQFEEQPYTVSRGGITELGPFAVGLFGEISDVNGHRQGLPLRFSLDQNYPNPFNPATTIRYTLAKNSKVKIVVYDLLGKEVATLVNTKLSAGDLTVEWNTENMASGIYIYKLITKDFVQARKMMLLK
jgi:xylan 1,4-beta-xylosidase